MVRSQHGMFESHGVTFLLEAEISSEPRMRNETLKGYSTEGEGCYHAEIPLFMLLWLYLYVRKHGGVC